MTRKFEVTYTIYSTLTLDDEVIDVVDDEWRKQLYNLHTPEEIAEHVGRNLIFGRELSSLDGWANQPNSNADIYIDNEDIEAKEIS